MEAISYVLIFTSITIVLLAFFSSVAKIKRLSIKPTEYTYLNSYSNQIAYHKSSEDKEERLKKYIANDRELLQNVLLCDTENSYKLELWLKDCKLFERDLRKQSGEDESYSNNL